jgi:VIT1/CCC1 family predicted Fe2+/Mn2+ transporter
MPDTHLHHDPHLHQENHLQSSELLRDIVIGMSDGLTVPFALAAGISGAVQGNVEIVWIAGLAEIAAGSIAMGLGGYLAGKTEQDHYNSELKNEYWEIVHKTEVEKEEVRKVFRDWGLSPAIQEQAMQEIIKDDKTWVDFMMKHELGLEKPDPKRAGKSAFNIGVSYIVGGLVPLTPYFFVDHAITGLQYSAIITLIALFVFGYFKSKMTGVPPFTGALKVVLVGAAAGGAAFGIARWIGG